MPTPIQKYQAKSAIAKNPAFDTPESYVARRIAQVKQFNDAQPTPQPAAVRNADPSLLAQAGNRIQSIADGFDDKINDNIVAPVAGAINGAAHSVVDQLTDGLGGPIANAVTRQ